MSSSAIGFQTLNKGLTGATGAQGAQGPIGPTGGLGGPTGATGNLAPYILNVFLTGQTATVELSDGTEYLVSGNFLGATGSDTTIISIKDPLDPGSDAITASLLASGNNTNSFVMRGLCGFGSLVVSENATTIFIDSIYTPSSGSLDSFGLTNNTLVYLKQNNQLSSTTIGVTSGNFYDGVLNFEKSGSTPASPSFSKLLPRSKVKYITPTYKTSTPQPVVLNVDDAGVFYVRTPNGISAFNGNFKSSEIVSFTLITESDDIWNFPSNVYFENGENYLTCGKSILNLTSFDQGTSWYATVAARGIDASITNCQIRGVLGSCCYRGVTGTQCVDYVTKNQCDILSGTFNPLQPCETSCGSTFGVCCSNGQCIEDANYAECLAFGGKFLFGVTCGSFGASQDPAATNGFRLCYDKCQNQKVACCKDGVCLGDEFTKIECENILEGVAFVGKACSEVDCCEQNVKVGACCKNQQCSQKTLNECKADDGVFMGEGELCENINCKCIGVPDIRYGNCCYCNGIQKLCKVTTEEDCETDVWAFDSSYTSSGPNCNGDGFSGCIQDTTLNCGGEFAKCCVCQEGETSCVNVTESQCAQLRGIFTGGIQCGAPGSCDPCTSDGGGPCADCVTPVPGVCCNCDNTNQPCIEVNDIKTECPSGYVGTPTNSTCGDNPCNCNSDADCDSIAPIYINENSCRGPEIATNFIKSVSSTSTPGVLKELDVDGIGAALYFNVKPTVKDFYLDVKGQGFHQFDIDGGSTTKDLRFCFELDLSSVNITNESFRLYILRTWYPKNFVQNYGAYRGFEYRSTDGKNTDTPIPYSTQQEDAQPSTDEITYWGTLSNFYPGYDNSVTPFYPEDDLSSYVSTDGDKKRYHILNNYGSYFNTDVLRKQLNCPLYGINPRGKAPYTGNGTLYKNGSSFGDLRLLFNNNVDVNNSENNYLTYDNFSGLRYYHSSNLGIRYVASGTPATLFTVSSGNLPSDNIRYNKYFYGTDNATSGITYIGTSGVLKSNYLLLTQTFDETSWYETTFNGAVYKLPRFSGYSDFGFYSASVNNIDFNTNEDVGFYIKEAILNNFANRAEFGTFLVNDQPGHPLTVDYTAKYTNITQTFPVSSPRIVPTLNDNSGDGIGNASGLYTTKAQSIIFDSGCITADGTLFLSPGIGVSYDGRNYEGAIGNPKDGLDGDGSTRLQEPKRVSVKGKYNPDRNSYNFCVTIPNWRDYIVDSEFANSTNQQDTPYYNEALLDPNDQDRKRFSDFFDKLRFVIYSDADIPANRGITGPTIEELQDETNNKSLKKLAAKFNFESIASNNYTLRFNNPDLCDPADPSQPCLCENYIPDYNSNCYVYGSARDICSWISGKPLCDFKTASKFFSNGLGSFSRCNCSSNCEFVLNAGGCHAGIAAFCSCGEQQTPCSCQGESIALVFGGCVQGDLCDDQTTCASPCYGDCINTEKYLGYSNIQYKRYGDCNSATYLLKLRPTNKPSAIPGIPGTTPELINAEFQFGQAPIYLIKDSLCGEITCPGVQPGSDGLNTSNFTFFDPNQGSSIECGAEFGCVKNRCVFSEKACNYLLDGPPTSPEEDYDYIVQSMNLPQGSIPLRLCGLNPYGNANVEDPLVQYTNQTQFSCAANPLTSQFINKLIPTPDGESICVPLECSVINCSEFEDCNPS
jgi:hypothetical protein